MLGFIIIIGIIYFIYYQVTKKETVLCQKCHEEIGRRVKECPYCGFKNRFKTGYDRFFEVLFILMAIGSVITPTLTIKPVMSSETTVKEKDDAQVSIPIVEVPIKIEPVSVNSTQELSETSFK